MENRNDCLVVIPARMDSSRMPGKPLRVLKGKPLVQHVYEHARGWKRAKRVVVATDNEEIASVVKAFGGECFLSKEEHRHGTSRVCEVWRSCGWIPEWIVGLQVDEPEVTADMLDALVEGNLRGIKTLVCDLKPEDLHNPNVVKVAVTGCGRALLFSRKPLACAMQHVGVYGFHGSRIWSVELCGVSELSAVEGLEQMEWLEVGMDVRVTKVKRCRSVNVESDLEELEQKMEVV